MQHVQNNSVANFLLAKWKQSFTAKPWLIYYPKLALYYQALVLLVVERGTAPLADLHLERFLFLGERMETQKLSWFYVMQKELAHL